MTLQSHKTLLITIAHRGVTAHQNLRVVAEEILVRVLRGHRPGDLSTGKNSRLFKPIDMKKKIFFAAIALNLGLLSATFAQNEIDALRYSQITYGGSARFTAMAGAFGSLGGDFSALSTNPAGIGIYRKSEFTFTPSFFNRKTTSNFKGNTLDDYKYNVNFSNAGIVLAYYEPETKNAWKGVMFGFGYNRLANFHNRISMSGKNSDDSMLDLYIADAQGVGGDTNAMDPFSTQLALHSGAIFMDTNGVFYHHLQGVYGQEQSKSVTSSGSMGETVFTLGGNYSDKLYLGATIGIPHIRYHEESTYMETADTNAWNNFESFEFNQDSRTTGVGFNFKFGMIYKPTDWVRVGGALHTPSYFDMHDDWSSDMTTNVLGGEYSSESPAGLYDYSLVTPMRTIGSIGFVIKKIGLIGMDYEFVDYPSATLRSSKYKYINENKDIRSKYVEGNNIRFGTEWRLHPLSLRAGTAFYSSPFKQGTLTSGSTGSRIDYTAGIGFREENFFLDFAYVLSQTSDNYYFYDASIANPSANTSQSSSILMTLGFKF